jgi:hypothetical protein
MQLIGIDLKRVGLVDRDAVDERWSARELAQLAGERSCAVLDHG